jgi:ATP-binding protein involved in chromosome partitioning
MSTCQRFDKVTKLETVAARRDAVECLRRPPEDVSMIIENVESAAVLEALRVVQDPDLGRDIVSLNFIKELQIENGVVSFNIELTTPACPVKEQMHDQAVAAVSALVGVTAVKVRMTANVRAVASSEAGRAQIPGVKNVIAVGAGKGGVGKSTVAVNLALALSQYGGRVGMIDADIYGPNVPMMLGVNTQLETDGKKIVPAEKYGIPVVSMGFLTKNETPIIWRGPMLHGVVQQFFREVRWDELDYLVVDMPPGTGDVALSLSQTVPVAGAVVVTTPQAVSVADSRRAVAMYRKLNVPVLGLVENMSHYVCPNCDHESDIFGKGGGEAAAEEMGVPFLGRIPIYQPIREGGDSGNPIVIAEPDSVAARAFFDVARRTAAQVSIAALSSETATVS